MINFSKLDSVVINKHEYTFGRSISFNNSEDIEPWLLSAKKVKRTFVVPVGGCFPYYHSSYEIIEKEVYE